MVAKLKYFAKGIWVDRHFLQWVTNIMIMGHVGFGMAVIAGGIGRFSIPSYNPLVDFAFGHTWLWGVWIIVSAVLMGAPFRRVNILGIWLGMVWHIIWTVAFTIAVLNYENAAATPIPAYGVLAMICFALLTARVIDKTEE